MKFLTVASYVFSEGEGVESSVMGMVYKFIRSQIDHDFDHDFDHFAHFWCILVWNCTWFLEECLFYLSLKCSPPPYQPGCGECIATVELGVNG